MAAHAARTGLLLGAACAPRGPRAGDRPAAVGRPPSRGTDGGPDRPPAGQRRNSRRTAGLVNSYLVICSRSRNQRAGPTRRVSASS